MSMEYQKWLVKLLGYNFDIVYKPGVDNKAGDGLSRMGQPGALSLMYTLFSFTLPSAIQLQDLYKEIAEDTTIQHWIEQVKTGEMMRSSFTVTEDKLWYKGRLVIPKTSSFIPTIFFNAMMDIQVVIQGFLKR